MNEYFLPLDELPEAFSYPALFHRVVELGLVDWQPWRLLRAERLFGRHEGIARRYPQRTLVPFADRVDRDSVACWDMDRGGIISIIEDFEVDGYEQDETVDDFKDWLRRALADMIAFED